MTIVASIFSETSYIRCVVKLTFRSSESNELIPLLDSLPIGDTGGCCLSVGDNLVASESDKNPSPSKSMLRAI